MTKIRKRKKNSQVKREMAGKLLGYSALDGAALAMGASPAEATSIHLSSNDNHVIDFDGDGTDDLNLSMSRFSSPFSSSSSSSFGNYSIKRARASGLNGASIAPGYSNFIAKNIDVSQNIDSAKFTGFGGFKSLAWNNVGTISGFSFSNSGGEFLGKRGFLGVRFEHDPGDYHYAWVDLEVNADVTELWIHDYGYNEDHNAPIHVSRKADPDGSVPEPGALALLAVGLPGLYAMRRKASRKNKSLSK